MSGESMGVAGGAAKLSVVLHSAGPIPLHAEFDCAAGELVALVGPSGSGKTSILRGIAGLLAPRSGMRSVMGGATGSVMGGLAGGAKGSVAGSVTGNVTGHLTGRVALGEHVWFDSARGIWLPPQQRRCGMVFQHYALFPHLNAIENIAACAISTSASGLNAHEIRRIAHLWLDRLGLEGLAMRWPHQLSGGQQQRVALARALMRIAAPSDTAALAQPSGITAALQSGVRTLAQSSVVATATQPSGALLLDEPFSAVDAPMRQTLYRELAKLRQNLPLPIILVTHDLQEARRLADKVVIVDAGHTLQSGPPEKVLRSPRNARVAELVGIHNHFSGQFHTTANPQKATLRWGDNVLHVPDKSKIPDNTAVTWVLAGDLVHVVGLGAMQLEAGDNLVTCTLTEALPLGEMSLCKLAVHGAAPDALTLNLPTAQLRAVQATVGVELKVAVPPEAVHIMPLRS